MQVAGLHIQQLLMLRHCLFAVVGGVMREQYAGVGLLISDCQMSGALLKLLAIHRSSGACEVSRFVKYVRLIVHLYSCLIVEERALTLQILVLQQRCWHSLARIRRSRTLQRQT